MKTISRRLLPLAASCLAAPAFAQDSARQLDLEIKSTPLVAVPAEFPSEKVSIRQDLFPVTTQERRVDQDTTTSRIVSPTTMRLAETTAVNDGEDEIRRAAKEVKGVEGRRGALEEVVVTAQRREERLQDVPISISLLSGGDLDSSTFTGITEALNSVPGAALIRDSQQPSISVRGVGAQKVAAAGSTPIAYYLDGIPFGGVRSAIVVDVGAYDLERIEVLRGPQGTLYGASALGGVVRVLTNDADLDIFELKARASSSSTEDGDWNYRGDFALNVPIVSGKLAARAVIGYQDDGGWIDKPNLGLTDANDSQIRNMRLKLNANPTEQLSIGVSAWQTRSDYGATARSNEDFQLFRSMDEAQSLDLDVYGLNVGYEFAPFSVESKTSYLKRDLEWSQDLTPFFRFLGVAAGQFPITYDLENEILSEEISFKSTHGGAWRWSAGAMYRDAKEYTGLSDAPANIFTSRREDRSKSVAVFGELTRLLLDGKVELTAGLRYFEDEVAQTEKANATRAALVKTKDRFDTLSPRAVLAWHPTSTLTAYASYSEGFRSGFSQSPNIVRIAPDFPPVKEDTLKNYEVGTKGSLWDGRLGVEAAVYYADWQDVQNQLVVQTFNTTINGGAASGAGVDLALTARPSTTVELGATFGWNDLTWDADVLSRGTILFQKGERLNLSPEYTAGAWVSYAFPIGQNGFEGRLSASGNFVSEQDDRTLQGTQVLIGLGDDILTARTSFSVQARTHWVATVFVDNVSNEDGAVTREPYPNQVGVGDLYVRPRTIGLQIEYRY